MVPVTVPVGTYILGIPRKYIYGYQYPLALLFFNQKFVCTNPCCGSDTFVLDPAYSMLWFRIQILIRIRIGFRSGFGYGFESGSESEFKSRS
jgi:hypothetical protein